MLPQPTLDKLQTLRLAGMYQALVEQLQMPDIAALTFEERFGLLVDRELTERDNRRLTTRLRQAKLRQTACIEDIDYRHPRGLDKALWPASPPANGCGSVIMSSSPARPGLAKPGWAVHWASKRAAMA